MVWCVVVGRVGVPVIDNGGSVDNDHAMYL